MDSNGVNLTLEQQFELRKIQDSIQDASHDQVVDLLLSVSQLLMVKDNVIRDLVKQIAL